MDDFTTGDVAGVRLTWMRLVLVALVMDAASRSDDPAEKLRSMERVVKGGIDAAQPQPVGPFDREAVKHICLEETEKLFRAALGLFEQGAGPKTDPIPPPR